MCSKIDNIYTIAQPKIYTFITKNLLKIIFFICLTIFIIPIIYDKNIQYIKKTLHIILILALIGFFISYYLKNVAYKVIIDFEKRIFKFHMCRKEKIERRSFKSIKKIEIKNNTKFLFNDKKIIYHGNNKEFHKAINRLNKYITYLDP